MRFMWKAGIAAILLVVFISVGCGDSYRPIAEPIIQPGGDPQNADTIYAMNQNPTGPGSVSEINVPGDAVIGNRTVSTEPTFITFDVSGSIVYTANTGSENLSGNSPGSNAVITISLHQNSKPVALSSNRSGALLVADQGHSPDTPCPANGTIGIIDTSNSVLTNSVCVGPTPSFVVDTGNSQKAFVLDETDTTVRVIDLTNNTIAGNQPTVGTNPIWAAVSADGTQVYVVNKGSNNVSVIDIASQTVVATIPTGSGPSYVAVDKGLNYVYVSNQNDNTLSIYNAAQSPMTLLRTVNVGSSPVAIAVLPDGSRAYVANTGSPFITEIKSGLGFQASPIYVVDPAAVPGATVTWVARSSRGTKVHATFVEPTALKNGTAVINTSNDQVVLTLAAPPQDMPGCDQNPGTCAKERQRPMRLAARF